MQCTVHNVIEWFNKLAPPELAEDWDRIGLQLGDPKRVVKRILFTLTVTPSVVAQARSENIDLIVAHHPIIFSPLTEIRWDRPSGALIKELIESQINVFVAHTNYDAAEQGTSKILSDRLGLESSEPLIPHSTQPAVGLGRIGSLPESLSQYNFLRHVSRSLNTSHLKQCGPVPSNVYRVAVMGGSGGSFVEQAKSSGADVYITGDIDFHDALLAEDLGLWVVDAGHFATERLLVPFWHDLISREAAASGVHVHSLQAKETDPLQHFCFNHNAEEGV